MTVRRPLEGFRVTDFTWIGAGSFSTKILADAGADVVKLESSTRLDSLRVGPPYQKGIRGINRSGYFSDRNSSKRSLAINLKGPRAREIVERLIAQSDVVANNFTPGVMARLGFDYESVCRIKPDIVYLAMSMQGATGPHAKYLGYGLTIGALCGLSHLTGLPDRLPCGTGTNYPDHVPNPTHAVFAVLAALWHRQRTGEGQYIDLAQTEPTISLLASAVMDHTANAAQPDRRGNDHPSNAPHGVYPCAGEDRWIAISVATDEHWAGLVGVLQESGFQVEPTWNDASGRYADRQSLDRRLADATRQWGPRQLTERLQAAGVPAGTVQDAVDLIERDPQLAHRDHFVRLDHPEMGETIYSAPPYRFSKSRVELRAPAPLLGQHTHEVMGELLDMSTNEVDALIEDGVLV